MHNPNYIYALEHCIRQLAGSDGDQTLARLERENRQPPQSQVSLTEQLSQLRKIGNEAGLYDAADHITRILDALKRDREIN